MHRKPDAPPQAAPGQETEMSEFIGYTIGLEANRGKVIGKMVKVEYTRLNSDSVQLKAVSGRDLSSMQGKAVITQMQFENRPQDAYNQVSEARWALDHCGWSLMSDDCK